MTGESPNLESAVCTPLAADAWQLAETEVRQLRTYERNWDGDGADPVRDELIESVLEWFQGLRRSYAAAPVAVSPLAGGTVMVEWHANNGSVVSVEIREPGEGEVLEWSPIRPKKFYVTRWGTSLNTSVRSTEPSDSWDGSSESPFAVAA